MHIVKISAGLGNQMFEYAFALVLESLYGGVKLDLGWFKSYKQHNGYELGKLFEIQLPIATDGESRAIGDISPSLAAKIRRKMLWMRPSHHVDLGSGLDPYYLRVRRDSYFDGYWQSYKYFEGREDLVRNAFRFVPPLSERNEALLGMARSRTLVGIHVRRGDYATMYSLAGAFGTDYYRRALAAALQDAVNPLILFFSDDLPWCKEHIPSFCEAIYVDWNIGDRSYEDMRLMIGCDRLVICNSTFSWWGGWLGERTGRKVFAPPRWFFQWRSDNLDIIPPEWIRIGD